MSDNPIPSTSELLLAEYRPVIPEDDLAEIFGKHVQTIRRLRRKGLLPFPNVSITPSEYRYRLSDVLNFLENPPAAQSSAKRRGRPIGSKNRQPLAADTASISTPAPVLTPSAAQAEIARIVKFACPKHKCPGNEKSKGGQAQRVSFVSGDDIGTSFPAWQCLSCAAIYEDQDGQPSKIRTTPEKVVAAGLEASHA